ncbi:hypothetical protein ACLOJK_007341 [Asimina triloba]
MAQGRGSAVVAVAFLLLGLLFLSQTAHAAVYTVGDKGGWRFNVYAKANHNVVAVNGNGYNGCSTPKGAKVYQTGNDRLTLAKGQNYFICNFPGHCQGGMKIAVTAA